MSSWFGLLAPAKTPAEQVQQLNAAFTAALAAPDVKDRLAKFLAEPAPTTPAQFGAFIQAELAKYEKVVKASGVRIE